MLWNMCKWCFVCYIINKLSSLNPDKFYLWECYCFWQVFGHFGVFQNTVTVTRMHRLIVIILFGKINLSLQSFILLQFFTCLNHLNVMCAMPNNRPTYQWCQQLYIYSRNLWKHLYPLYCTWCLFVHCHFFFFFGVLSLRDLILM